MPLELSPQDRVALEGGRGDAVRLAMRIVTAMAEMAGADHLLDVTSAHVDGCLYHGRAGLDFARRLLDRGATVAVPTTLNVSSLDLLHPELVRLDEPTATDARSLMDAYVAMGCRPTWTCAPYQLPARPALGEHVAWAESNAIVFANSVLGARTDRYGDFMDACCAVTGRAPAAGLHLDEHRRARAVFTIEDVADRLLADEVASAAIGHLVGRATGPLVPAVVGLLPASATTEDHLKALGAAAASSGSVAMVHAVGITPEAPTLEAATGGAPVHLSMTIGPADLRAARDELSTIGTGAAIGAVSVGTPHCSVAEFEGLAKLADGRRFAVPFYVNTGRDILAEAEQRGTARVIVDAGATIVTDTCTYITPVILDGIGPVVTNSGKWAWYAPGNMGLDVAFASLNECVRSAVAGHLVRDESLWGPDD
jgi:predicted aconitase